MSQIQVPTGWELKRLDEIAEYINGRAFKPSEWKKTGIPIIRIQNLTGSSNTVNYYDGVVDKKFYLEKNDLLVSWSATIDVFIWKGEKAVLNQHIFKVNPHIDKKCMFYILKYCLPVLTNKIHGSGMKHITYGKFKETLVPVPPPEIQKKLVQKLDYILEQFEEKKRGILSLVEHNQNRIKKLTNKTIGSIITKIMSLDTPAPEWKMKKLEQICIDIQPGFAEGKKDVADGIVHLRMNNIGTNFKINYELIRKVNASQEQIKKYQLQKGDVIFNNTNSTKLVGKSAIFQDNITCLYSNHLTRLRVDKEIMQPDWLLFYLRARWLKGDFERMCNKWINQAAVNNTKIKELIIPIPPIPVQNKIIERLKTIDTNFQSISQTSEKIKKSHALVLKYLNSLKSVVLTMAFSGKLIS